MRHKTRTRPFLFDDTSLGAAICAGEASGPARRRRQKAPNRMADLDAGSSPA
jgi:hypothetical protein